MGIADNLLSPPLDDPSNLLGDALALQVVHLVFGAHLVSLEHFAVDREHWLLLGRFMPRWAHRSSVRRTWPHGAREERRLLPRVLVFAGGVDMARRSGDSDGPSD